MGVVGAGQQAQGVVDCPVVVLAVDDVVYLAVGDHLAGAVIQGRVRDGDSMGQWLRDNGIRVDFGPLKPAPTSQVQEVVS